MRNLRFDFDLEVDEAIYAIVSVDAHGMKSNYSEQIHIKYDKFTNTLVKKLISAPGAPIPYPNYKLNADFFEDVIKVSGKKRAHIFFDPEYYEVYRSQKEKESTSESMENINFIKVTDENSFPYLFHFINTDNQNDETLEVRIRDETGLPVDTPMADINEENLSFEFGV
jgi:hypothetical protein